jgi:hypothetical protein
MLHKHWLKLAVVLGGLGYAGLGVAAQVDYFLPNGQKVQGEVVGNKLMLKGGMGGTSPAPDGTYQGGDGKAIIIQNGIIITGGTPGVVAPLDSRSMKGLNPQPEPPSFSSGKKPMNPGEAKGFNPQPDPPGKQGSSGRPMNPGELKGFNPQPDPPGKAKGLIGPNSSPAK